MEWVAHGRVQSRCVVIVEGVVIAELLVWAVGFNDVIAEENVVEEEMTVDVADVDNGAYRSTKTPNSTSTTPSKDHSTLRHLHPTVRSRHTNHHLSYTAQYRQTFTRYLPKLPITVNVHQTTIISRERCDSPASRVVQRLSRVFDKGVAVH